jgi:hypothetical protein
MSEFLEQRELLLLHSKKIEKLEIGHLNGFVPDLYGSSEYYVWNHREVLEIITFLGYVNLNAKECVFELTYARHDI